MVLSELLHKTQDTR